MALTLRRAVLLASALALLVLSGCALPREQSKTPRSAIEQLLLGQALERSLVRLAAPIPEGESITVEATGFTAETTLPLARDRTGELFHQGYSDLSFARDAVSRRLGQLGLRLPNRKENTAYLVRVIVQALGTEQATLFFGLPAIQSALLPVGVPEITIYKAQHQKALARLSLDVFDVPTGRLLQSTPWYEGSAYYNQYTVLLWISFRSTDLELPP
jgi:hypothetical protein